MLTVKKLRRKPKHFHNFTGLSPEQFDELLTAVEPLYERNEQERLDYSGKRKRHTAKMQVVSTRNRLVLHQSAARAGKGERLGAPQSHGGDTKSV